MADLGLQESLRDLLNDGPFALTFSANGQEQIITGELVAVKTDGKFDYIIIGSDENSIFVRLDLITKVERIKGH